MKKTLYVTLSALILLCGCSEKILPIRGVKKTVTPEVVSAETPLLMEHDTIVPEAVEAMPEAVTVQRAPIPEEWTTIEDDSLVVLESMSGELDSLLNSWYANTYLMVDTTCTATSTNCRRQDCYLRSLPGS